MAMLKPAWMQANAGDTAISYSAQDDRRVLKALWSREGVLNKDAGDLKIKQRALGANMSVDIQLGQCAIFGEDVSDQGAYECTATADENRSTFSTGTAITAPGTGSRTHRVVAQIRDKKHNGIWTGYDWEILILQDTGTGTPAVPNSAIPLGRFTIAAGQASITDANIIDDRLRASVGTPWLTGNMLESGINAAYGGRDGTRPLTWTKNPDGWVFLAGWISRTGATTPLTANATYYFDGGSGTNPILPAEARPSGVRDMTIMTSIGPLHAAVYTNGAMSFRSEVARSLVLGAWFSFDSMCFRANAFS